MVTINTCVCITKHTHTHRVSPLTQQVAAVHQDVHAVNTHHSHHHQAHWAQLERKRQREKEKKQEHSILTCFAHAVSSWHDDADLETHFPLRLLTNAIRHQTTRYL